MKKPKLLTTLIRFYEFEWLRILTLPFRMVSFQFTRKFITIKFRNKRNTNNKSEILRPKQSLQQVERSPIEKELKDQFKERYSPPTEAIPVIRTFFVYILRSLKDKKFYIGTTDDLHGCYHRHNTGQNPTTFDRMPFELIYYEAFMNFYDAKTREKYLQSDAGQKFLKKHLKNFLQSSPPTKVKRIVKIVTFVGVQILILFIPTLLAVLYSPSTTVATWFDSAWTYRQSITITNNGSQQTNYIVPVIVDTQSLISAGKMQSDCDDARFATSAGTSQNYFLEVGCNTTTTLFFVKVDTAAAGTSTLYFYYGNASATSGSTYDGAVQGINYGTGIDGSITVSTSKNINTDNMIGSRSCADGGDAVNYTVTGSVSASATTVTLSSTPSTGCLAVNDEILIINMQGTSGDNSNVGKYETARITAISTATLTLNHALVNAYDGTTQKIMVQRIPNYTDITVCTTSGTPVGCTGTGTLTASAWNGSKGGIIFFRANGTVNVAASGTLSVNTLGYRGGNGGASGNFGGISGESYDGSVGQGSDGATDNQSAGGGRSGNNPTASPNNGAVRGGGGGGGPDGTTNVNGSYGAGGGGGYGFGGGGGGGGGDNLNLGGNGGAANSTSVNGGGGGGGRTTSGTLGGGAGGSAGSAGSTATGTGGNVGSGTTSGSGGGGSNSANGSGAGGGGGGSYGDSTLTKLYFGSGGGGGGSKSALVGQAGKTAGGIVVLYGNTVTIAGAVSSNGDNATCSGQGAGAGGSILVGGTDVTAGTSLITATGGARGVSIGGTPGCGGGGGDGRIYIPYSTLSGTTNPTMNSAAVPVASSPSSEEQNSTTAPVLYYKFDEGQGTAAHDSTGNNTGTISGSTWQSNDQCISGSCLYLDESGDYINGGTSSTLGLTQFSLSIWAKWSGVPTGSDNDYLIERGTGSTTSNYYLWLDADGGACGATGISTLTYGFRNSDDVAYSDHCYQYTPAANEWHQYAVTYDGSNIILYIDGKIIKSEAETDTPLTTGGQSINFGSNRSAGNLFNGFLDEAKIYSYARTTGQILADYSSRGAVKGVSAQLGQKDTINLSNNLIAQYKMDESSWNGTASEMKDSSGNNLHGSSVGATVDVGKFGGGGLMNGTNNYVAVSDNSLLTLSEMTASAWVKFNSLPTTTGNNAVIIYKNHSSGAPYFNYSLSVDNSGGSSNILTFKWVDTNQNQYTVTSSISITTGVWYQFAATKETNKLVLYMNGSKVTEQLGVPNTTGFDSNDELRMGGSYFGGDPLNGIIDDVRLYNRAFNPGNIKDLYQYAYGPSGYWKLDERSGTTTADSSSGGGNGTVSTVLKWTIGKYGNAIDFPSSTNNVGIPLASNTQITEMKAATLEAWIYPRSEGANGGNIGRIFGKHPAISLLVGDTSPVDTTNAITFIKGYATELKVQTSNNAWVPNRWQHIAATWDGSKTASTGVKIYVNGIEQTYQTQQDGVGALTTDSNNAAIGASDASGSPFGFFDGYIDEVRVYNYARSYSQVVEDMNGGHPIGGSPIGSQLIYAKFDEQQGTTVNNSGFGGSTYTTTMSGATWLDSTRCKTNGCLNFDTTTDTINYGDVSFVDGLASMSASLWINPQALSANRMILSKAAVNQRVFQFQTDASTATALQVYISASINDTSRYCQTGSGVISTNSWQHFTFVYDGSQPTDGERIKLYKNGRRVACTVPGTIPTKMLSGTTSNLKLGKGDDTASSLLAFMDEFKLYNTALTQDQILIDYNQGAAVNFNTGASIEASQSAQSNESPPVGYWNFDENKDDTCSGGTNDVCDRSGYGNDGAKTNMILSNWIPGKIGSGMSFDGINDRVQISNANTFNLTSNWTISAWVKPLGLQGTYRDIITKGDDPNDQNSTFYMQATDTDLFEIGYKGSSGYEYVNSTTSVPINRWTHVVGTYSSTNSRLRIYINGIFQGETTTIDTPLNVSDALMIGAGNSSSDRPFWGYIDDVKIYNYERNQTQVSYDYNRGGPIAWWKFDECLGTTANDSTGLGLSGTINIGVTIPNSSEGTCSGSSGQAWYNGAIGKFNSSLDLDGIDDSVTLPASTTLFPLDTSWSVSTWFQADDSNVSQDQRIFVARRAATGSAISILLGDDNPDDLIFIYYDGSTFQTLQLSLLSNLTSSWHHVVATYNGTTFNAYLDGKLAKSVNDTNFSGFGSGVAVIGENLDASNNFFNGRVDDTQIYNYPLSLKQVQKLYNNGTSVFFGPATGSP